MNFYSTTCLIAGITNLLLALFVLFNNPKRGLNIVFFLLGISLSGWSFGYLGIFFASIEDIALKWLIIPKIFVPFIPITYFHFSLIIIEDHKNSNRNIYIAGYIITLLLVIFDLLKGIIVQGVKFLPEYDFYFPGVGRFHFLFDLIFIFLIGYGTYLLYNKYRLTRDAIEKKQLLYLLIGICIGIAGGISDVFLEYSIQTYQIYPLGHLANILCDGAIIYAITNYRLMNIHVRF
ncbi:MAG: histidine kinase N-terminal 7TM domain-containing protein [bacterium]